MSGLVPDSFKIAKVCHIFKSGSNADFTNYRTISVLPSFSKIFENLVYNRLLNYLSQHSTLSNFRNNHDISMTVLGMIDKITNARDSLNHNILFDKLEHYGVRGVALQWFKSYLHNRSQNLVYNGLQSAKLGIKCGVPQGSILGTIVFLIYIHDITNVFRLLQILLFADDTIFLEHRDYEALNKQTKFLKQWGSVITIACNQGFIGH